MGSIKFPSKRKSRSGFYSLLRRTDTVRERWHH